MIRYWIVVSSVTDQFQGCANFAWVVINKNWSDGSLSQSLDMRTLHWPKPGLQFTFPVFHLSSNKKSDSCEYFRVRWVGIWEGTLQPAEHWDDFQHFHHLPSVVPLACIPFLDITLTFYLCCIISWYQKFSDKYILNTVKVFR